MSGATPEIAKCIEQGIGQLKKFLARPEVIKTLKFLKIDNPYKYLATEFRKISASINTARLIQAFDSIKSAAEALLDMIRKWGDASLAVKVIDLLKSIDRVRRSADQMLYKTIEPLQNIVDQLARRLDIEADMAHRVHLNHTNPHALARVSLAEEEEAFKKSKPDWVDETGKLRFPTVEDAPIAAPGWTSTKPDPIRGKHVLDGAHETFNTIQAIILPPGSKMYRIVAPNSADNSICWMSEHEFSMLKAKGDWRRRFAVWINWNSNGEYIIYVVPPGKGLHVWEGITGSQSMKNTNYVLEGGGRQIVANPADLFKGMMQKRRLTNWVYDGATSTTSLVGVPTLHNNWFGK